MFSILMALLLFLGILVGSFMALVWYLRQVIGATIARKTWVRTVPRVAFPLFAGNLFTHRLFGQEQLMSEMNQWYLILNVASVVLFSLAVAHLAIRRRITGETIALNVLFVVLSAFFSSLLVVCL